MIRKLDTDNQIDNFSTFDLGCSAALVSVGFELISLDKQNPRKVLFIFSKKAGIDQAVIDYFSDKLKVSARTLFDNTKMIKNRIYSNM
jgi:hypothetical protein